MLYLRTMLATIIMQCTFGSEQSSCKVSSCEMQAGTRQLT